MEMKARQILEDLKATYEQRQSAAARRINYDGTGNSKAKQSYCYYGIKIAEIEQALDELKG